MFPIFCALSLYIGKAVHTEESGSPAHVIGSYTITLTPPYATTIIYNTGSHHVSSTSRTRSGWSLFLRDRGLSLSHQVLLNHLGSPLPGPSATRLSCPEPDLPTGRLPLPFALLYVSHTIQTLEQIRETVIWHLLLALKVLSVNP